MTDDDLFLPEPEPREVVATIGSVDNHLAEPADCENAAALFRHPLPERVLPEGPST